MLKKIITVLMSISLLSACASGTEKNKTSDKLQIYTSFHVIADFAKQIAGDKAEIINLTQNGEMHDFEISAAQMAKLCGGDLFIYCGGADKWAEDIAETVTKEGGKTLETSEFVTQANDEDAHIWLDPDMAMEQMSAIYDKLLELDEENREYYEENYKSAEKKYNSLKNKIADLKPLTEGKPLLVVHGAYGYLCEELGMEQIAVEGTHGDSDPTAAQMAGIIDFAKENNIKYIFTALYDSSKVATTVANEISGEMAYLDSMEEASGEGDYFIQMEKNIEEIKKILGE